MITVDDADSARVKKDVELTRELGVIILTVHRTTEIDREWAENSVELHEIPSEISEKALKGQAVSHGVA